MIGLLRGDSQGRTERLGQPERTAGEGCQDMTGREDQSRVTGRTDRQVELDWQDRTGNVVQEGRTRIQDRAEKTG